jgi:hypothetical protein
MKQDDRYQHHCRLLLTDDEGLQASSACTAPFSNFGVLCFSVFKLQRKYAQHFI